MIYLDNSATTKTDPKAAELMLRIMTEDFGNPSSLHQKGVEAEGYIREAKKTIGGILKAEEKELYFTSGGTESDNWAVFSAAKTGQRKGKRIITTQIEHPAVLEPFKELERQGYEAIYLPVDGNGFVDENALAEALSEDTILVSVMYVNNEVGSIQPVSRIGSMVKEKVPDAIFHVDAVQAFGKLPILPGREKIDLLSVSGHKIHGPKGTGLLYASSKVRMVPYLFGGGQQKNMRSGTENVPGIAGLAEAAKLSYANLEEDRRSLYALKDYFAKELTALPDVEINGPAVGQQETADAADRTDAPHIVNASFLGVRSEVLLHSLEDREIYVSAGSACSSHKQTGSATLRAMGLSAGRLESAIRFSFSVHTTKEELDTTLEALRELLPALRRFTRR
ncbi:MAG: cysteine desulfurase [Lachnospiraceae bacterium]|nr:cysteine desulfurase [Lachnospiraceae bacterium]